MIQALVSAGLDDEAEAVARLSADPSAGRCWLVDLSGALARAGRYDQAETIALSLDRASSQAALTVTARELASAGFTQRAALLAAQVEARARSACDPGQEAAVLSELAQALVAAGQAEPAARAASRAQALATVAASPSALAAAVRALSVTGRYDQAEQTARGIPAAQYNVRGLDVRDEALASLATALAAAGLADRALAVARSIRSSIAAETLASVVTALAGSQPDRAVETACSLPTTSARATALASLARTFAAAGQPDRARQVATQALCLVRGRAPGSSSLASSFSEVSFSWPDRENGRDAGTLAETALALAEAGLHESVGKLAAEAEETIGHAYGKYEKTATVARVAHALTVAGLDGQARRLVDRAVTWSLDGSRYELRALAQLAKQLAEVGLLQDATRVARQCDVLARRVSGRDQVSQALTASAQALAAAGLHDQADAAATAIPDPVMLTVVLPPLAAAATKAGQSGRARKLVARALIAGRWTLSISVLPPDALVAAAAVLTGEGPAVG